MAHSAELAPHVNGAEGGALTVTPLPLVMAKQSSASWSSLRQAGAIAS